MALETKLKDSNNDNIVYVITLTSEERQVKKSTTYQYISLRSNFSLYTSPMVIVMGCKCVVGSQKIRLSH